MVVDRRALRVTVAIAPMQAEPRAGSEQISQRLAGQCVELLRASEPWLRVRGGDGYEGWMHRGYLVDSPEGEPPGGRISLGCVVREDGRRRQLPLGAVLNDAASLDGGDAVAVAELRSRFPAEPDRLTESTCGFFEGTPYLWGGITPWGSDCSGMVQSVFGLHGILLPRDARDQALSGHDAGTVIAKLWAADLLFFSDRDDRRITHVGVSLGGSRMAHVALGRGGFAIENLDQRPDPYVLALTRRFLFARRVLS
ncbi:MAG: C40 family peptidase [Gemmatimonadota bacterium]|nr:C40 family peptidase [Gemmatimonadota bacterium]